MEKQPEDFSRQSVHRRLLLEHGNSLLVCAVSEICCIHTDHGYTKVLLADGTWGMTAKSLSELEGELPETQFCRISRQTIVNIDDVRQVEEAEGRDYAVILRNPWQDRKFPMTAEHRKDLIRKLDC